MQIYKFIQENMHYPPDKSKISLYICENIFDMETITEKEKQAKAPKTFASNDVKQMGVQYIQLHVPISFNQVVDIVRQLSPFEKQQLGEVLWDEQNDDDMVIPEEHKRIVRGRINKYENSPDSYLSWDDIELKMATRK